MREPSGQRKRILLLHERAIRFSNHVNQSYPHGAIAHPSRVVWDQLVRAADGVSNNLIEADAASSEADFLHRMRVALREAKESKVCLIKVRLAPLANAARGDSNDLDCALPLCIVHCPLPLCIAHWQLLIVLRFS